MKCQIKITCIFLLLGCFLTPVKAAEKIALVIGNSDYEHIDKLKNPVNDATAVAQSLKKLGFKIFRPASQKRDALLNLNQNEIFDAINGFREAAKGADIALVYYAGHGAQLDGKREAYILPVDVPDPTSQSKLRLMAKRSISINEIMEDLSGQARLTVAIFDACRNIPKIASLTRGLNRSDYLGLAKPSQVRKGQIVAYAGAAGELVPDA